MLNLDYLLKIKTPSSLKGLFGEFLLKREPEKIFGVETELTKLTKEQKKSFQWIQEHKPESLKFEYEKYPQRPPPKPTILTRPQDLIKEYFQEKRFKSVTLEMIKREDPSKYHLIVSPPPIKQRAIEVGRITLEEAELFELEIMPHFAGMGAIGPKGAKIVGTERIKMATQALAKRAKKFINPILIDLENYWKSISMPRKLTLKEMEEIGIAKEPSVFYKQAITEYTKIRDAALRDLKSAEWAAIKETAEKGIKVGMAEIKGIQKNIKDLNSLVKAAKQKLIKKTPISIEDAQTLGIALRETKAGKLVPSIRKSGPFVPEEFAKYKNFKDVKAGLLGGSRDITRAIQEIDGILSVAKRVKLPGQAGVAERYILWRTRDFIKMKMGWTAEAEGKLRTITAGISDKEAITANRVLERLRLQDATKSVNELLRREEISGITKDSKIIKFAQEARKYFDELIDAQNRFRALRNQDTIPYRKYYSPHELQKTSLWERTFGLKKEPIDIMKGPELPDYIKPNKIFNPRELAREADMPEYMREMNLKKLLENYTNTASKDIFNTSIIQNNKIFAQQFETMGFKNSARLIQDWTAEAFAGVKGVADRAMALGPKTRGIMNRWREGLMKAVFPLNFAWNMFIQTSSGVLTVTRYGIRSSMQGMLDWITKPAMREWIRKNAYSYIVKTGKAGKITRQDINVGMSKAVKLEKSKLDTVTDAFNYFTEWTEKHLTGWSVATAKREGFKRGLRGKALTEFASDGGSKTQSMYNLEDLPGVLRNETVKTAAPFQTFSFEMFNSMREWAGKTGVPPSTATERIGWVLRFLAGINAVNYIGGAITGRKPWELSSFIPFYGTFFAPIEAAIKGEDIGSASTRGLPSPIGIGVSFGQGIYKYITKGDSSKLRNVTIKYLPGFILKVPAGLQASRIVDGIIAIAEGGVYDSAGRMKFPIYDTKDKIMAIFKGPWATKGGKEYWQEREKSWLDLLKKPFQKEGIEIPGVRVPSVSIPGVEIPGVEL